MRKVLIPYQQDLINNYNVSGFNEEPIIINQRFVNYANLNDNLIGLVIPYDNKYIDYIKNTEEDISVLIPGGENIGDYPDRDSFELKLIETCIESSTPLLGICKGMQEINLVMGGSLRDCDNHWQDNVEHAASHTVVMNDGLLFDKFVKRNIYVNSFHRQCLDNVASNILVEGVSKDDGVPECISVKDSKIIGVQWHPSYAPDYYLSQLILDLFAEL